MVLGAIWCPTDLSRNIARQIKAIKKKHGLSPNFEIKWTKISPAKVEFYLDLLHYFFEEETLFFRALIVPDKTKLHHALFSQDHDTWYYKMYFDLLKVLLAPNCSYYIYLDIKDSRSGEKTQQLHEVLSSHRYVFQSSVIEKIQNIRSHESALLQLADLLMGCVLAANRNDEVSPAKKMVMERMIEILGTDLTQTTYMGRRKVNLLRWVAAEVES